MQRQKTIEAKIREYEHILISAAALYHEIQQSVSTQSNNYNLDVMTRLTTATINFKNTVEQTDAAWDNRLTLVRSLGFEKLDLTLFQKYSSLALLG